jgi:hypothetical protein
MFKIQQNESPYGEIVTVTERIFWFDSKRQQNESPYGKTVTVTETFSQNGRLLEIFS